MKTFPDIKTALRLLFDRWWLIPVAGVATLLIFYQLVLELARDMPKLGVLHSAPAGKDYIPLGQIEQLSGAGFWTGPLEPLIPLPPPVAPPAPPTKMKVAFTYQGYFETADRFKLAYVKVADKQVMGTNGGPVTADYVIAGFDLKTMTVRNAVQTNVLKFNTPTELDVPLK